MYLGMVGSTAKQKKKRLSGGGGGGGAKSVSIATSSSGNFNNAVKVAITNSGNTFDYSNGVKDGSNSSFGTASSPTRTTQTVELSASHYSNNTTSVRSKILVAGFIRNNNFTSADNYVWSITSVSSSLSNGCSLSSINVSASRQNNQDNTTLSANGGFAGGGSGNGSFGIYSSVNSKSTSYPMFTIQHGSGRGASTVPASGDTVTLRITASDSEAGTGNPLTTYTAVHDLTIEFVS